MPSIFPQGTQTVTNHIILNRRLPSYGKSPVFDFETGEFKKVDGKVYMAEGVEVLRNWIDKTLRTERYRFPIYSFNYGVTLEELIVKGLPYDVMVNELKVQITDALIRDARIAGVRNFMFSREGSFLNIEFEVETFDKKVIGMEVKV